MCQFYFSAIYIYVEISFCYYHTQVVYVNRVYKFVHANISIQHVSLLTTGYEFIAVSDFLIVKIDVTSDSL